MGWWGGGVMGPSYIVPRDHDPVRLLQNLIEVINTLLALNLTDYERPQRTDSVDLVLVAAALEVGDA